MISLFSYFFNEEDDDEKNNEELVKINEDKKEIIIKGYNLLNQGNIEIEFINKLCKISDLKENQYNIIFQNPEDLKCFEKNIPTVKAKKKNWKALCLKKIITNFRYGWEYDVIDHYILNESFINILNSENFSRIKTFEIINAIPFQSNYNYLLKDKPLKYIKKLKLKDILSIDSSFIYWKRICSLKLFLQAFPNVEELEVENCFKLKNSGKQILYKYNKSKEFTEFVCDFFATIMNANKIKKLKIKNCDFVNLDIFNIYRISKYSKRAIREFKENDKELSLASLYYPSFFYENLNNIFKKKENFFVMNELIIDNISNFVYGDYFIAPKLSKLVYRNMKKINIENSGFEKSFFLSLKGTSRESLETLDLSYCSNEVFSEEFFKYLKNFKNLKNLIIKGIKKPKIDMARLFYIHLNNLEKIDFSNNMWIDDKFICRMIYGKNLLSEIDKIKKKMEKKILAIENQKINFDNFKKRFLEEKDPKDIVKNTKIILGDKIKEYLKDSISIEHFNNTDQIKENKRNNLKKEVENIIKSKKEELDSKKKEIFISDSPFKNLKIKIDGTSVSKILKESMTRYFTK